MTAVSSPGAKRARRGAAASCSRVSCSTTSIVPLVRRPYGCAVRIEQRHQRLGGADRRVVLVLADRGDDLALARRELVRRATIGAMTMSASSARTGSKSSARQVQTSENRWRVTTIVSVMPRLSSSSAMSAAERVAVPRSITRDSRYVAPGASGGSQIDPARIDEVDGDGRRASASAWRAAPAPLSRTRADGLERPRPAARLTACDVGIGSNQPIGAVRRRRARARAAAATSSSVTAAIRAGSAGEQVDAGDRLEVAELVRDVGDAVVVEHQPRAQLRLRLRQLGVGDAVAARRGRAPRAAPLRPRRAACPRWRSPTRV